MIYTGAHRNSDTKETAKNGGDNKAAAKQIPLPTEEPKDIEPEKLKPATGNSAVWNRKGKAALRSGKYQEAIEAFTKALSLNPDDAEAYGNRALAYMFLYEYLNALKDFNKQIELRPEESRGYSSRGFAYYKMEFFPRAISDYSKALELKPDEAESWYYRGLSYGSSGDTQQAVSDIITAARLGNKPAREFLRSEGIEW